MNKNGGGEIRTHGRDKPSNGFKPFAINRSATPPLSIFRIFYSYYQTSARSYNRQTTTGAFRGYPFGLI